MKFRVAIMLSVSVVMCVSMFSFAAENDANAKGNKITDIIATPIKAVLSPIKGEGLADIITDPIDMVLSPTRQLGEVVITPSRTPEYVYNIDKNVSMVDSDEIEYSNDTSMQEAIQKTPSVVLQGYMNNPKDNNIGIRGFGETGLSNYLVLVDGRRTNQIDMSGADLSQIDINAVDRIEIIRGANSVLYGDNATGGVVNIITKKGEKGDKVSYRQEVGSFQYTKEYASASGGHEFLDYFASYSYQNSDGYRLNNGYEAKDVLANITMRPVDYFRMELSTAYHRDWYGQPGAMYIPNIQNDGREGSRFPNSKGKTEDYYFTFNPILLGELGDNEVVLSAMTSFRSRRSNSLNVWSNEYDTDHHIGSVDFRPKCEINSSFFGDALENKLVFGADYFQAVDGISSGDRTLTKANLDIRKETFGIYADDNILLNKRFIFSGGVRGEWTEYIFDQNQPAASYDTRDLKSMALEAGVGYKYNERSEIYGNYAKSYRYATTDEYFQSAYEYVDWWTGAVTVFPAVLNTSLKQQVANNYEIGIKDNSFEMFNVKADYYLMDVNNEIYYDPITYMNQNYNRTIHHGFELEGRANILKKVEPFLNYTFEKAYFVGEQYAGNDIPLVPENKISGGFDIKPIVGLNINFSTNYVGSRYLASDQANTAPKLKSYVTMDAGFCYEYKNFKIFGAIKNMFDVQYYSNGIKDWQGYEAFYPAPGRTFEGGVGIRF
ncbi:MAG TPA: TonB-dependent receptor [Candidatus Omnitrophota bacterium]|nr:TonB-dependent receptor [Candidatus Omnitrophota bacterium]HPS20273.1 TonB-dependent receptor [Candidatus Omnitrophota bacterium]